MWIKKMDKKLDWNDVIALHNIFTKKKWFLKMGQESVHKNLCELVTNLTDEQKQLIFDLCNRYVWISNNEYLELLLEVLEKIEDEKIENVKRIIVFPIVKPKDIGKIKSSASLLYNFKSLHFGTPKYNNIEFKVIDSYKNFAAEKFTNYDLLFLVDDYIGSGQTLFEGLEELKKNQSLENEMINVIALVAQTSTLSELNKKNISSYVKYSMGKGISENFSPPELEINIELMKEIEKLIPANERFSFGFEQTEALVTMARTPNNTFPIFWRNHRKNGKVYEAPFPRY